MEKELTIGARLKKLREEANITQNSLAVSLGVTQSTVNRYEHELSQAPYTVLLWYADTFNVSLDYLFCRTDNPFGKYFEYQPEKVKEQIAEKANWSEFVRACFEEGSPMNKKLKEMLVELVEEEKK